MSEYIITEDEARNLVKLAYIEAENAEQFDAQIAAHEGKLDYFGLPEVVRCGDCAKWSYFDVENGKRIGDCAEWTHLDGFSHATNEDGFCAWGERK